MGFSSQWNFGKIRHKCPAASMVSWTRLLLSKVRLKLEDPFVAACIGFTLLPTLALQVWLVKITFNKDGFDTFFWVWILVVIWSSHCESSLELPGWYSVSESSLLTPPLYPHQWLLPPDCQSHQWKSLPVVLRWFQREECWVLACVGSPGHEQPQPFVSYTWESSFNTNKVFNKNFEEKNCTMVTNFWADFHGHIATTTGVPDPRVRVKVIIFSTHHRRRLSECHHSFATFGIARLLLAF